MKKLIVLAVVMAAFVAAMALRFAHRHPERVEEALEMLPSVGTKHSVSLQWKASPGAQFYNVYRATHSGGPYVKLGTTTTSSYVDYPVRGGAVYYYVVSAVNQGGESKQSSEIKAVVP